MLNLVIILQLHVSALYPFCVHHQVAAHKNIPKELKGALIIQFARTNPWLMHYTPLVREMTKMKMWLTITNLKTKEGSSNLNQLLQVQFLYLLLTTGLSTHILHTRIAQM